MEAAGMSCDFVGHPAAAGVPAGVAAVAAFRDRHGLGAAPVVLALPGSRRGEVARLAPRFGAALGQAVPAGVRVVLPTLPAIAREVRAAAAGWPVAPLVVEAGPDRDAAFATARAALAASGTVSLELAAHGVPMVIGYDFNPVSRFLIWRMARIDTVTLVNLVSGTRAVPEFLGTRCRAELMAPALAALLQEGPERDAQAHAMAVTMARLGRGGEAPGLRAARSVLAALARPGRPGGAPALRP
jgi:lipid-A-disaccharide synthase